MRKQINFRWRHQPFVGSKAAILLKYIEENNLGENATKTELIMLALNAHYYPLAYRAIQGHNPKRLEKLAQDSIFALISQINEICSECGFDKNQVKAILTACFGDLNTYVSSMPTQEKTEPMEEKEVEPEFDLDVLDLGKWMIKREFK